MKTENITKAIELLKTELDFLEKKLPLLIEKRKEIMMRSKDMSEDTEIEYEKAFEAVSDTESGIQKIKHSISTLENL